MLELLTFYKKNQPTNHSRMPPEISPYLLEIPPYIKKNLPVFNAGEVWLAGAGPGDPSLITIQTIYAIKNCDVVFIDALAEQIFDACAYYNKKTIRVGKRAGKKSINQKQILNMLTKAAKQNKKVLRIKGGDPLVFSRATEEIMHLINNQIPTRILPGVTSGIGGLAYSGIPFSYRKTNQIVSFITAHDETGELSKHIKWNQLTNSNHILIIFMGARLLKQIVNKLIQNGRHKKDTIAILSKITSPEQSISVETLDNILNVAEIKQPPTPPTARNRINS